MPNPMRANQWPTHVNLREVGLRDGLQNYADPRHGRAANGDTNVSAAPGRPRRTCTAALCAEVT